MSPYLADTHDVMQPNMEMWAEHG